MFRAKDISHLVGACGREHSPVEEGNKLRNVMKMLTMSNFSQTEGVKDKVETVANFQSPVYYTKMHEPR